MSAAVRWGSSVLQAEELVETCRLEALPLGASQDELIQMALLCSEGGQLVCRQVLRISIRLGALRCMARFKEVLEAGSGEKQNGPVKGIRQGVTATVFSHPWEKTATTPRQLVCLPAPGLCRLRLGFRVTVTI